MRDFRTLRAAGSRWAVALSLTALAPVAGMAQDTTTAPTAPQPPQTTGGRTHSVRTGDTLWDLARVYLGDPFLWPEIYRLNTEVVEDPHWIYPGETLRLPEGSASGISSVDGGASGAGGAGEASVGEAPSRAGGTVFAIGNARRRMANRRGENVGRSARPLIRSGDYHAAPVIVAEGGIPRSGRIGERVEIAEVVRSAGADRMQIGDRMTMTAPNKRVPLVGEKFLTYRLAEELGSRGQVMVPTGIVEVLSGRGGIEAMVQVVEVYDAIRAGQHVTTIESFTPVPFQRAEAVDMGIRAEVLWIESNPMLPSLHQYLIVGSRETDGVRLGDQFTLYGDDESTSREILAVAQVIRTDRRGTTLMIIDQDSRGIRVGTPVRLTAKMP